ncbi:hypothetical protein [Gorillibacterium sp. sgz5001074]|uniref:hypothetical protein n=1 Tax=Gorillibacterium sp. sgz5001074 TaxID=3446695 RepID=UPI003F6634FF
MNISKEKAASMIDMLISSGVPVNPQFARDLYKAAELPVPEYLKHKPVSLKVAQDFEKSMRGVVNGL